jgi:hypothetical protein
LVELADTLARTTEELAHLVPETPFRRGVTA